MSESVESEETAVAATNAEEQTDSDESQGNQQDAESAPAAKKDPGESIKSRIDELTKFRREAERERDYWREQALRQQQREPEPAKQPEPEKPKTLADFEYDEAKYQAYLFEQAEKRATDAAERRLKEQAEREQAQRRISTFNQREQAFVKDNPDYFEKTRDPRVPITQTMVEVIAESEDGPALAYYLANNVSIAAQIAQLPPMAAARELGRIEARLAVERERAKEVNKVSKAPPPAPQIDATDASRRISTTSPESDKLSDEEWVKAERARLARRNKRRE